jgi:L-ascorbate 6-phosphate lactonase
MTPPAAGKNPLARQIDTTVVPPGSIAIWYLGQSGFAVKGGDTVLYLDPYLSDFLERYAKGKPEEDPRRVAAPMAPDEIEHADYLFGSHWHYDHIDPTTVGAIAAHSPDVKIVVPTCARKALVGMGIPADRLVNAIVDTEYGDGRLSFVSIPSAHETFDVDPECGYPYWGYIIRLNGVVLYHAGDCIPYAGLIERLTRTRIDVAMLPMNGRDYFRLQRGFAGNFTYREAAELAAAIKAGVLLPMHVGMHMANTEHPGYLADFLSERFPHQKYHFMVSGEKLLYSIDASAGFLNFCAPVR